jgi:hypothetical protein
MKEIFDVETWRQVLVSSMGELGTTLAAFLPSLAATVVILAVGWLVSRVVAALAGRLLRRLGLDRAAARLRFSAILEHAGIGMPPSEITARLVFWMLMLTFVLSAVDTLGLVAVTATIDRLIAFLPKVIAAGLLFLLGLLLARLAGNLVSSARGSFNNARARTRRRFMPPERESMAEAARSESDTSSRSSMALRCATFAGMSK